MTLETPMHTPTLNQTTALVLETNNLRGDAKAGRIPTSLGRLLRHLRHQTRPVDELVITHDGLDDAQRTLLCESAGRAVRFVELPADTGYYEAKNLGFAATTTEVVAFGDADCWPDARWLERLLAPFDDPGVDVVSGRTTYRPDVLGTAATAIDFIYFPSPLGPGCVRNFYANNVAFRRSTFDAYRYEPARGVYRGHCQLLGLRLQKDGVAVRFEPGARTFHRFPDRRRQLLELRLLRGADATELGPTLVSTYAPRLRWLNRLGPVTPLVVLGARFVASLRHLGRQDLPARTGLERVVCVGAVAGLSLADAAGAVARSVGLGGARDDAHALAYHGDRDRLAA